MKEKLDNIYAYIWEEFNTIYIGRTINPKTRHYAHKHRETEKTYKFSSEHHVEHPKMIIIENDLTVEEGVEREKYWINYYRTNTDYNVLNKRIGGQIGNQNRIYTDEEIKKNRKKYYQKNKYKKINYQKKYNKNNEKHIKEYQKKYLLEHKNEKKLYDKEYQKKWYEANKEKKKEYHRKWREKNREKLREKAREYLKKKKGL